MRPRFQPESPAERAAQAVYVIAVLSDLIGSAEDLHLVDPDPLAMLLNRIAADLENALEAMAADRG